MRYIHTWKLQKGDRQMWQEHLWLRLAKYKLPPALCSCFPMSVLVAMPWWPWGQVAATMRSWWTWHNVTLSGRQNISLPQSAKYPNNLPNHPLSLSHRKSRLKPPLRKCPDWIVQPELVVVICQFSGFSRSPEEVTEPPASRYLQWFSRVQIVVEDGISRS